MKIQLLDGLTLDDKGVLVNRNGESVHRRQGDIDGACGPYCIVMAHLALGDMTGSEIEPAVKMDFRTRVEPIIVEPLLRILELVKHCFL